MSENSENAALEAEKVQGAKTAAAGAAGDQEGEEESLILKFKKPYKFEGREYTEVDLSAMEDMTAADLCAVAKLSGRDTGITPIPEMTIPYAIHMAARASKLPVEFSTFSLTDLSLVTTSQHPSFIFLGLAMIRTGIPIKSASLNITPALTFLSS